MEDKAMRSGFFFEEHLPFEHGQMLRRQWTLNGIRIFCLEGKVETGYSLQIGSTANSPTLLFVEKGEIRVGFSDASKEILLKTGMQNALYSAETALFLLSNAQELRIWAIEFSKNDFLRFASECGPAMHQLAFNIQKGLDTLLFEQPAFINLQIQSCLRSILETAPNPEGKALLLRAKAIELLSLQAITAEQHTAHAQPIVKSDYDRERLLFAKEFLLKSMAMPPSLPELARIAGINEFKLKRGFKALFGETVFGYLAKARLELAKKALEKGNQTATEIAFELGFSSLQHFSAAFKKHFGISPSRFDQR
jgi:AraC family transcriptional activator of pyochelin receptor